MLPATFMVVVAVPLAQSITPPELIKFPPTVMVLAVPELFKLSVCPFVEETVKFPLMVVKPPEALAMLLIAPKTLVAPATRSPVTIAFTLAVIPPSRP